MAMDGQGELFAPVVTRGKLGKEPRKLKRKTKAEKRPEDIVLPGCFNRQPTMLVVVTADEVWGKKGRYNVVADAATRLEENLGNASFCVIRFDEFLRRSPAMSWDKNGLVLVDVDNIPQPKLDGWRKALSQMRREGWPVMSYTGLPGNERLLEQWNSGCLGTPPFDLSRLTVLREPQSERWFHIINAAILAETRKMRGAGAWLTVPDGPIRLLIGTCSARSEEQMRTMAPERASVVEHAASFVMKRFGRKNFVVRQVGEVDLQNEPFRRFFDGLVILDLDRRLSQVKVEGAALAMKKRGWSVLCAWKSPQGETAWERLKDGCRNHGRNAGLLEYIPKPMRPGESFEKVLYAICAKLDAVVKKGNG